MAKEICLQPQKEIQTFSVWISQNNIKLKI